MIGILCEKPSAARNFAKALGGGMKGTFEGQPYVIVSARGHLYEFVDPENQVRADLSVKYKSWAIENLPWNPEDLSWTYRENRGIKGIRELLSDIRKTLADCDTILIGTDVDPTGEGELLAWEILQGCKLTGKKIGRMYFMDESEKEIQKAFRNRTMLSSMESDADWKKAFYRARWDYMSMQWTRVASGLAGGRNLIRMGRLKSAMVKIVGDGFKALSEYVPIPFYQNRFRDENGVMYIDKEEPTYKTKEEVPQKYEASPVILDKKETKHSVPPKLIDLATLSSRLAAKGYKPADVLSTYQTMYEDQVVSYPRTEDKTITPEQFNELLPLVGKIADVVGVDKSLITHTTPRSTHVKTGGAHGANRPGPNVPKSLEDLRNMYGKMAGEIYQILAVNYLTMLGEDYVYEKQTGHLEKYPSFVGATNVPKELGWKQIQGKEEDGSDEEEETSEGLGKTAEPFVFEGVNKKPPTPTMKWLMKQLEKHDVGTGATRTSTYADVTNQNMYPLLTDTRGKITMAKFGEIAYGFLPGTYIGDLRLTEQVMAEMRKVHDGSLSDEEGLQRTQKLILNDIDVMQKNAKDFRAARPDLFDGAAAKEKEKYSCVWEGKEAAFNREYSGHRFTDEECEALAKGDEIVVMDFQGQNGELYAAKGRLEVQTFRGRKYLGFTRTGYVDKDGNDKTPAKKDPELYASGIWKKKEVYIKKTWGGHTFTEEELKDLFAGKEISFVAKTKEGKEYTATGKLANQTYNGRKFVGFKPEFKKGK